MQVNIQGLCHGLGFGFVCSVCVCVCATVRGLLVCQSWEGSLWSLSGNATGIHSSSQGALEDDPPGWGLVVDWGWVPFEFHFSAMEPQTDNQRSQMWSEAGGVQNVAKEFRKIKNLQPLRLLWFGTATVEVYSNWCATCPKLLRQMMMLMTLVLKREMWHRAQSPQLKKKWKENGEKLWQCPRNSLLKFVQKNGNKFPPWTGVDWDEKSARALWLDRPTKFFRLLTGGGITRFTCWLRRMWVEVGH